MEDVIVFRQVFYFSGDFTVTVWGNHDINTSNYFPRILCFTNWGSYIVDSWQDVVFLDFDLKNAPHFTILNGTPNTNFQSRETFNPNR